MAFNWNPMVWLNRHGGHIPHSEESPAYSGPQPPSITRNTSFEVFKDIANDDIDRIVSSRSVISRSEDEYNTKTYSDIIVSDGVAAVPVPSDKSTRIQQYRQMAMSPECSWCLDEICDDFLHEDEMGNFINLTLPINDDRLNSIRIDILQTEFKKFINLFNFKENGYTLIKKFLIEGELAWENIIKESNKELGIIAVKFLPCEFYEYLLDTNSNKPCGIIFDIESYVKSTDYLINNNYVTGGASQIFNTFMPATVAVNVGKLNGICMMWPQVTYINTGDMSFNGLVSYSLLERAKRAYYQLALLQDAAVILRVTRAPERLLFNISTGKMTQNYADEYVKRFARSLKSKKVVSPEGKNIGNVYNPVSMLESYIFSKSDGNDGTTIESVGSTADFDQINDLEYFLRRLMKQFKIPFTRYKTPENTMERDDTITYEEYSFSRMIIRFQQRFSLGLKKSFITHLKLRGIWDKYELKPEDIQIEMVKPILYDLYQTQKLLGLKMDIYKAAVENQEEMSKILAMKKYLKMTDDEIEENFRYLIKEKEYTAMAEFYGGKMEANGPEKLDSPIKIKDLAAGEGGGEEEAPEMGGMPPEMEGGHEIPPPEEHEAPEAGGEEAGSPPEKPKEEEPPKKVAEEWLKATRK